MKKAVAYARFSSDMQREESIDAQIRAIKEYCQKNNIELIRFYSDEGISGTTDNRPQFQEMIKNITDIDYVVVHKLDRFSRNRYDSAVYKRKLKQKGIKVLSVLENLDDSPESVIMESVLEGMSEYYSRNLSREVKKGLKENALKCQYTGGTIAYGYSIDENKMFIINEKEAEAVRIIFRMFVDGYNYNQIIDELERQGHKTRKGGKFKKTTLYDMLKNERYKGTFIFSKNDYDFTTGRRNSHKQKSREQMIIIENGNPAIVSPELWEQAQKRKQINRYQNNMISKKQHRIYLLSGLIFCKSCNSKIVAKTRKNYGYYFCPCKECEEKSYRDYKLEDKVVDAIDKILFNDINKKKIADYMQDYYNSGEVTKNLKKLEKELNTINEQLENVLNAIMNGFQNEVVKNKLNELEKKKEDLLILMEIEKQKNVKIDRESILKFLNRFNRLKEFPKEDKKIILNLLIERVFVDKSTVEIKLCVNLNNSVGSQYGAPSGARTLDTLIKSQVLYQLS